MSPVSDYGDDDAIQLITLSTAYTLQISIKFSLW